MGVVGLMGSQIDWAALAEKYAFDGGLLDLAATAEQVAHRVRGRLVYLATPYSKEVTDPQTGRFELWRGDAMALEAARWSAIFASSGVTAISPIVAAHAVVCADAGGSIDPLDARFWTQWCAPLLSKSEVVVVPPITGRARSAGVFHEAAYALRRNVRVMVVADERGRGVCHV